MDEKGVYKRALKSKQVAAYMLLPLIEFEFGFLGDDTPTLVQAKINMEQFKKVFHICKVHKWASFHEMRYKVGNPYFRISREGFSEIYKFAGPFASKGKNKWAKLLLERKGIKGGYRVGLPKTEERVKKLLKKKADFVSTENICLGLRLMPNTVREALLALARQRAVKKKIIGRKTFWKIK